MDLLQAYNQVAERYGLNPMRSGGLQIDTRAFDDPDTLWQAFQECGPVQGWFQFQSWQSLFDDGLPVREDHWGLLLQAEAVCSDGTSLAIGPDGYGGWRFTRYSPQNDGDWLWDEIAHISHDGARRLRYRRYWQTDDEQGLLQRQAVLVAIALYGGK